MDVTAREANKKRKGMKSPTDEEEVPERDSKLVMALARLALQHESERRANARDDNAVFSMPSSGELAKELQWAADKYVETGAQLKKEQGENYKGHPIGKKPDAMLASLLYRMHQAILTKVGGDSATALERSWRTAHTWKRTRRQLHFRPCKSWRREQTNPEQFGPRGALSSSPRKTKQRNG